MLFRSMVDEIGADGVVQVHRERDLEFGPHTVGARDQNGILILVAEREQSTKTADVTQDTTVKSFLRKVLDPLFGAVGPADIHACGGVGNGTARLFGGWGLGQEVRSFR